MKYLFIYSQLKSNKKRIFTLHRSFVINFNTIKFAKFAGCTFFKDNILLLLKTFLIDNYYFKSWPTLLNDYIRKEITQISHSENALVAE